VGVYGLIANSSYILTEIGRTDGRTDGYGWMFTV